jgi:hypothetical protein
MIHAYDRMTDIKMSVMAQIGSYVPAEQAEIGLHDAIFTSVHSAMYQL